MTRLGRLLLVAALAPVFCCHSSLAVAPEGTRAPASTPAQDGWTPLTWEQRHSRMVFTVLPAMARRFHRFEGTPHPELGCRTCHGDDAEDVDFRMPNGLAALDPENMPSATSRDAERARTARFMADVVLPTTDRLMQAGGTLTCFSCHPGAGDE